MKITRWRDVTIPQRIGILRWTLPVFIALLVVFYQSYFVDYFEEVWGHGGHFYLEVILYGVAGPAVTFFILSWIRRWQIEKDANVKRLRDQEKRLAMQKIQEGSRIAQHLHREVLPNLAYVANKIDHSKNQITANKVNPSESTAELGRVTKTLRETIRELRRNINSLRRGLPLDQRKDGKDIVDALRHRVAKFGERFQLDAQIDVHGSIKSVPYDLELSFWRIIGEALNNIALHAKAQHAWVKLDFSNPDQIQLSIIDDGKGFAPRRPESDFDGLGLKHIYEEADKFNGNAEVKSKLGEGTKI